MYGRHLSNIFDHRRPDAQEKHCYSFEAMDRGYEGVREEWQHHLDWIKNHVVGPPKATDHYTQAELIGMGMIGIYAPSDWKVGLKPLLELANVS